MKRSFIAIGLSLLVCLAAQAQSPHPIIGTWEMNVERSTFDPGPGLQSDVYRYEEGENGFIVFTFIYVDPSGNPGFIQTAFKLDGEGYPIYTQVQLARFLTAGTQSTNLRVFRATNANTIEHMPEDNPGESITWTVSGNGQTLTHTETGTNTVLVFDRVQ